MQVITKGQKVLCQPPRKDTKNKSKIRQIGNISYAYCYCCCCCCCRLGAHNIKKNKQMYNNNNKITDESPRMRDLIEMK